MKEAMIKRALAAFLCLALALLAVGCNDADREEMTAEPVNIAALKEKYPQYFDLSDFKGIEVYVWQMAENSYRCGLLSGTNRLKTDAEIQALQFAPLSIEEAKAILDAMGVKKEGLVVYPISQAYSSYFYEIDDEYRQRVSELFG